MEKKENIRPIYSELQGYLSQTSKEKSISDAMYDAFIWDQFNTVIDELNSISGNNYDRFKINPKRASGSGSPFVQVLTYRSMLGGLISRLHGEFFSDEPPPFSGMPTTIISQSQQQTQSFQIQMLLEIQSTIDEKIHKFEEGAKEKKFLERVKASLASIGNITQLVALLLKVGNEVGLTIEQVAKIFS